MGSIIVNITSAIYRDGAVVSPGTTLRLEPLAALDLVTNGKGVLAHAADLKICVEARHAETRAMLRHTRTEPLPPGPWLPLH